MQINTIFLRDTLNTFAPHVDTKYMTFTDMKNLLKTQFNFKGKLTKQEITRHFEKGIKPIKFEVDDIENIENEIVDLKKTISKIPVKQIKKVEVKTSQERKDKLINIRKKLIEINKQLIKLKEYDNQMLSHVGYRIDEENQIQDIAYHSIDSLNVDTQTVDEFMDDVRTNPFNWNLQHELYDTDVKREITRQLSLFIEHELMQENEYQKNKYAVITLINQYGKKATHRLNNENLRTLIQMLRTVNFIDDGYQQTFEEKDKLYWEEYNLSVDFIPKFIYHSQIGITTLQPDEYERIMNLKDKRREEQQIRPGRPRKNREQHSFHFEIIPF